MAHLEAGLPRTLRWAIGELAAEHGFDYDVDGSSGPRRPDLYLGTIAPPDEYGASEVSRVRWIPIVHFARWERSITGASLRQVFRAAGGDWSMLGDESGPLELVADRESLPLIARALGLDVTTTAAPTVASETSTQAAGNRRLISLVTPHDTVEYVAAHPGALGIVPVSSLSFQVRALSLDACGTVGRSPGCWWLASRVWFGALPGSLSDAGLGAIRARLTEAGRELDPSPVTLTAVGDIILGRKVDEQMTRLGDYTSPFREVASELAGADLTVADLETPLTDRVVPSHDWNTFTFATSTRAVAGLRVAGVDAVSLANNHSPNSGAAALVDTITTLDGAGIRHFGGGRDRAQAHRPAILEAGGLRFAFLGYDDIAGAYYAAGDRTPGTAPLDAQSVVADIRAAREVADVVVPFFHWGVEYTGAPTDRQRQVARAAVDAGATLVLGSHPHWPQAVEFYRGAFIAYSLGNFVFDQSWSLETQQGLILNTVWLNGRLAAVDLKPVHIYDLHQPRLLASDAGEGRAILERVLGASGEGIRGDRTR